MTSDCGLIVQASRVQQLETGLARLSSQLDAEIAQYEASAARLQFWDSAWNLLVTVLLVLAPVVVSLQALFSSHAPTWAIVTVTTASAAVLLQRSLDFRHRFVVARTVSGRLTELRLRTEFDLSDLPASNAEYHEALRKRLREMVEGYVDISGEQSRAELGAIWRIVGLGEGRT